MHMTVPRPHSNYVFYFGMHTRQQNQWHPTLTYHMNALVIYYSPVLTVYIRLHLCVYADRRSTEALESKLMHFLKEWVGPYMERSIGDACHSSRKRCSNIHLSVVTHCIRCMVWLHEDKLEISFSADINVLVIYHSLVFTVYHSQPCMNKRKRWIGMLPGYEYQI